MKSRLRSILVSTAVVFMTRCVWSQELTFTHFTQDREVNPLPSSAVTMVYQDRLGYIWMVIYSSGLLRYDGTRLQQYSVSDGLLDLDTRQVLEDSSGRLWVASDAGLVVSEFPLADYEVNNRVRFAAKVGST